jgi:hypothetical protein
MIKTKKILFSTIAAVALIFSLNSCAEKVEKEKEEVPIVVAPAQIVPIDQAKSMYDNYSQRRSPLIQHYEDSINGGKEKFDVARYVSYDYETIKQYLAFIEQEAERANIEISGLRFYFSNYPDKPFFDNKDSILHPRQNSIMLSPTLKKGDRDYIFYIGGTEEQEQAVLLSDSFGEIVAKGMGNNITETGKSYASFLPSLNAINSSTSVPLYGGGSLTMNRGSGAPPPYNEE